jgi:hypothetical protein
VSGVFIALYNAVLHFRHIASAEAETCAGAPPCIIVGFLSINCAVQYFPTRNFVRYLVALFNSTTGDFQCIKTRNGQIGH